MPVPVPAEALPFNVTSRPTGSTEDSRHIDGETVGGEDGPDDKPGETVEETLGETVGPCAIGGQDLVCPLDRVPREGRPSAFQCVRGSTCSSPASASSAAKSALRSGSGSFLTAAEKRPS